MVDDTKENLTVIGQLLMPHYHVRVVNSWRPRLAGGGSARPDPTSSCWTWMMPEMDGYEVLKALRANPACQDIPVIFVTALRRDTDEELGLSLGAVDYVTKPVKPALLLARVRAQLELKKRVTGWPTRMPTWTPRCIGVRERVDQGCEPRMPWQRWLKKRQ